MFVQYSQTPFFFRVNSTSKQMLNREHYKRSAPLNTGHTMITEPFIYLYAWND